MEKRILVVDPDKCTGCRTCEIACSLYHYAECNPRKSRVKVFKHEVAGVDVPAVCQNCGTPICRSVCPAKAITKDKETGKVSIDQEACIGCEYCAFACPFSATTIVEVEGKRKAILCDHCGGEPKCAKYCETGALSFVKADEAAELQQTKGMKAILFHTNPNAARMHDSRVLAKTRVR